MSTSSASATSATFLDRGDRKILLFAGALLVVFTVAALLLAPADQNPALDFPSSYSTMSGGAKAAYLLLGELGYRAERWTGSPADLPERPRNTVLIVADPVIPASAEEVSQLRRFVAQGGRLIITGIGGAELADAKGVKAVAGSYGEWLDAEAELPAPLTRNAPRITIRNKVRWVHLLASQQRYYGDQHGAMVVGYRVGKGDVIWWADDLPLTNVGLSQASNLTLFLNSVGPPAAASAPGQATGGATVVAASSIGSMPAATRVLWDEYFHGLRMGLWDYLRRTPVLWALLQVMVLAAFVLATYARRSGPVRPLTRESRLSPLEFVDTMGALYERKRAAPAALEISYGRFRFLLTRRLGLTSTAPISELIRDARERMSAPPEFAEAMERIEAAVQARQAGESDAVKWVGTLYGYTHQFGLEGNQKANLESRNQKQKTEERSQKSE